MKRLTILGSTAFAALLFAPAAVIGDPAGPPGGVDVFVVNPPDTPIPVEVLGVPEVDVSNTPETPLHVRDVDRPTQIPYIHGCDMVLEDGDRQGFCSFEDVEVGKRLVVEFMSGEVRYAVGHTGQVRATVGRPNGFFTSHYLVQALERANVAGTDRYVISQPLRLYIGPEGQPGVVISRSPDDTGIVRGDFWVTGYLVDVDEE